MERYGLNWPEGHDSLHIELAMIKSGGYVDVGGQRFGKGKFHHYREASSLLWPKHDHHRWSDLCLKRKTENDGVVLMGPGDSNKTWVASKYVLMNYWRDPSRTLWIVSSTELRGSELRNWGAIKILFNQARQLWPWLPGQISESRHCISTDEISDDGKEGRLLTRGIIFVPCKKGNSWVGLGALAGIKPVDCGTLGHYGDECFPSGTMVDCVFGGPKPIEQVEPGELIHSARGPACVLRKITRTADKLVTVHAADGRRITCTPEHPFLTQNGWIKACDLNQSHYMMGIYEPTKALQYLQQNIHPSTVSETLRYLPFHTETLRGMRQTIHGEDSHFTPEVLQPILQVKKASERSGVSGEVLFKGEKPKSLGVQAAMAQGSYRTFSRSDSDYEQPHSGTEECGGGKDRSDTESDGVGASRQRWKWNWANPCGVIADGMVSGWEMESCDQDQSEGREWVPSKLQSGFGISGNQTGHRSGWEQPQSEHPKTPRPKENWMFSGSWVDRVEVQEFTNTGVPRNDEGRYLVYNLQIVGHPSYAVNGFIVHNCGFMHDNFLDAYANWTGKENFEAILNGNPTDLDDPLCQAAKPPEGWEAWHDTGTTQEWRSSFYDFWVVALDGRDSPNLDPENKDRQRAKYPYLIGKRKQEMVKKVHGEDSAIYWQQCIGKPMPGTEKFRIIPHTLPDSSRSFEDAIWEGAALTDVVAVDAAYGGVGGDRCALMHGRFGMDVEGRNVIEVKPPVIVPVSVRNPEPADDQIAKYCKNYCEGFNVPGSHFFFDGRSTLALKMATLFSKDVNVVDFGGVATKRPVSNDEFIFDGDNNTRRLAMACDKYNKFVTELWFAIYYLMTGKQLRGLTREVAQELRRRLWRPCKGRATLIEVETKAEMKERTNESPDLADALVTLVEGARRLGFEIEILKDTKAKEQADDDFLERAVEEHRQFMKAHELHTA